MKLFSVVFRQGSCGLHFLVAAFFLFNTTHTLFDFPLDDSWIHRVYARSVALGQGLAYNFGELEAGSTSPFWSILTAPVHWGEMLWGANGVVFLVKMFGLFLGCIAIRSGMRLIETVSGATRVALWGGLLWAIDPRFICSSLSGMENNLLLALWLAGTLFFVTRRYSCAIFLFSLMPVTRPEGLVIVPISLMAYLVMERGALKIKRWLSYAVLLLVPFVLWVGFCLSVTGHPLPNTFYVKAVSSGFNLRGWSAACRIVFSQGFFVSFFLWMPGFVGIVFAAKRAKWTRPTIAALLLVPGAALLYFSGTVFSRELDSVGYYFSRWLDPPVLLLTGLICMGLCWLFTTIVQQRPSIRRTALLGCLAAVVVLGSPSLFLSMVERRRVFEQDCRAIYVLDVLPGKWLSEHTKDTDSILVDDAGGSRYFSNRHIIDCRGLNNKSVAFENRLKRQPQYAVLSGLTPVPPERMQAICCFSVPLEEYSICKWTKQSEYLIYRIIDEIRSQTTEGCPPL